MGHKLSLSLRSLLVGMSQIMLQENAWTGALFLLGLAVSSSTMLLGAALGVVAGTAVARLLRYNPEHIARGLYGFNGALVGIALFFFLPANYATACLAVAGAGLSSLVMRGFLQLGIPAYTAPFVLVSWALLALARFLWPLVAHQEPIARLDIVSGILEGVGQVMFQASAITGLLFLAGLLVASKRDALWATMGSAAGLILAIMLGYPNSLISAGLFGYNAVLCGIALSRKQAAYPLVAIVASVLLTRGMDVVGIAALTAPFVLSTWSGLALEKLRTRSTRR